MTEKTSDNASFGYRTVNPEEKPGLVQGVFSSVAGRYDLMNDLMSGGVHRLWKASLIDQLRPRTGQHLLDVAGGTGDIAFRFLEAGGSRVTVCDLTENMVRVGRDRAIDKALLTSLDWTVGDAQRLPIAESSVDAYTIAFGLRNVTDIDSALSEAYRVLRPGGRFLCLEFSQVALPVLDKVYDTYSFKVLPALGKWVAKDEESYRYLAESIRRFPPQDALCDKMRNVGFQTVTYRNLSGGIAAIHQGWRI
ncbi:MULTISPECIES: bifunctional demethylmenaquinone methyltransferase/2-methoxy-6-polyprenyl-1,4-benzoquinol methylase UbiE [unclassified Hwanghaeella]|jgi:demethylmenaquinone methyltransferase/2-methoxy-6-polyprenyl-1,4-benzoquinol methylase|uniref:bifunctional demethylmenaquinone methyltransferase/2-methoxy-6-polyprenyl-1,4-benzoquinol methylase UbiE n=1 Tax=unclassified Hwanghaeella TaxID=2605944 RepID=UPI000C965EF1|nr:bifunctional demethylmenaquinone methyltransferase/2-methoxy-6-polyprenyl-1,4-benzoquinol methylase UbiE [Rhodospirillales bacterium]|tara:strand:- start:5217 stop:5966 length:750 start_codon:yes stop_codon:yes gene_type:complete